MCLCLDGSIRALGSCIGVPFIIWVVFPSPPPFAAREPKTQPLPARAHTHATKNIGLLETN